MKNKFFFCLLSILYSTALNANELSYSLSAGWPFLLTPSVSFQHNEIEYYANYKLGLDDGFSVGAEKQMGLHTFGVLIGAIGSRDSRAPCDTDYSCDSWRIVISDQKTTQGLGVSYEYRFLSSRKGWAFRLEAGYGEYSRYNMKRIDANLQVVYHFF